MKLPSMQFYPADWRKDPSVQSLDFFERGVWFEMLCLMHESNERGVLLLNGLPMPGKALSTILGLDNQILTSTLETLLSYGVAQKREDGAIYSKRMVKDENLRKIRKEVGKLGGNPNLVKQKPTTKVKQKSTPSSSSSSSSSKHKKSIKTLLPKNFGISERVKEWAEKNGHKNIDDHLDSFIIKSEKKGYKYANWDSAFMGAIRDNWAGLSNNNLSIKNYGKGVDDNGKF